MVKTLLILAALLFSTAGIAARSSGATVAPINAPTVQATPLTVPASASAASDSQGSSSAPAEAANTGKTDTAPQTGGGLPAIEVLIGAGLLMAFALGLSRIIRRKAAGDGGAAPASARREPQLGNGAETDQGEADRSRRRP
jgi:hypothetical protein